jgi:hypothetical protein
MNNVDATRLASSLMAGERLTTPTVKPIEPEVRSGGFAPFCDLLRHDEGKGEILELLQNSVILGTLVIEWGYDVPFNKHNDFKKWLMANEAGLAAAVPDDVTYRGTYLVSATSEKHSGLYRTIWAYRTLDALANFDAVMRDSKSPFARLIADLTAFRDRDRGAEYSQQMYQPARCADRYG